jgi:glutathione-regulated potassium-efflux system ancillary protein KefC
LTLGDIFRGHDLETLRMLSEVWGDEKSYSVAARQRPDDLSQVLAADRDSSLTK